MRRRRHLFDNGFPVSKFTRYAGSQVLLAVARHSLRTSRQRLGTTLLLMAESSKRTVDSLVLASVTRTELRESRDNFNYGNATAGRAHPQLEASAGQEPGQLRRVKEPHQP